MRCTGALPPLRHARRPQATRIARRAVERAPVNAIRWADITEARLEVCTQSSVTIVRE